jgi:hypothetical protein
MLPSYEQPARNIGKTEFVMISKSNVLIGLMSLSMAFGTIGVASAGIALPHRHGVHAHMHGHHTAPAAPAATTAKPAVK